ncbi:MAG: type II secretion system GspH family protein [Thermoanaerobaculia bacterium]|nr:type II secretion system GspH family protein [Thermoanaerobaculia bacterium]
MRVRPNVENGPANQQAGFTLIEVLVIAILVALILLSLVPLFSRSMMSNLEGWNATEAVKFGRTELEDKSAILLDRPEVVLAGPATETTEDLVWHNDDEEWLDATDPDVPGLVIWEQTTRVRQFSVSDLVGPDDEEKRFDNPLSGEIDPRFVHFREINVWVEHQTGADVAEAPGASRGLDATVMRSY